MGGYDVDKLGNLIHNAQDFYAHSNYVELYMEYYKASNNGTSPSDVLIYDEGVKMPAFKALWKEILMIKMRITKDLELEHMIFPRKMEDVVLILIFA